MSALLEPDSCVLGVGGPLAARQVDHVEPEVTSQVRTGHHHDGGHSPPVPDRPPIPGPGVGGLGHVDHEEGVGPGAGLVGGGGLLGALLVAALQESHHLVSAVRGHLGETRDLWKNKDKKVQKIYHFANTQHNYLTYCT